ncbi:putative bifunctional diguanylate cyclase/phosphodiesterase [Ruegeria jejuensis]|uniref:putative bifunctional diguanylate cyclase/phosphodiesterase n=1 Tax=Ruegeria jejuensis TaxID=3233338 RepID=UPI00355C8102
MQISSLSTRLKDRIVPVLTGPPVLAFLPAITLGAFWLWGETALLLTALGLPLLFAFAGALGKWPVEGRGTRDTVTGLLLQDSFLTATEDVCAETARNGQKSACFLVELDDYTDHVSRLGQGAADHIVQRCGERVRSVLRDKDIVARMGDNRFAICLAPVPHLDLELSIQLAERLQEAVENPISLDGSTVYVSCSIGFCQFSRFDGDSAKDWLAAADLALEEAQQAGPSAIRAFSPQTRRRRGTKPLRDEIGSALDNGQIQPWFQPQISTETGHVVGFEALARWSHPLRGNLGTDVFLPLIAQAGLLDRLGQVMLYHSLTALKAWDSADVRVPSVGVNFTAEELRNPALVERIRWELDRFGLTADRLAVEVLENVFTDTADDTVTRNIAGLGQLGCKIDLDDFGTGHASIAAIRRFAITRIKIDRSFVAKADRDPEQQRMIGAILTMAERLELETLAEGVETVGEHALLAQLGCDHVQGFGIGRPMPFDQTLDWISAHEAKVQDAPRISRKTG